MRNFLFPLLRATFGFEFPHTMTTWRQLGRDAFKIYGCCCSRWRGCDSWERGGIGLRCWARFEQLFASHS